LFDTGGTLCHANQRHEWTGKHGFGAGDVVGLLLDCDVGTLTVKKNGKRLGVAATGLTGGSAGRRRWAHCVAHPQLSGSRHPTRRFV
jgi:hypothetical protein